MEDELKQINFMNVHDKLILTAYLKKIEARMKRLENKQQLHEKNESSHKI